MSDRLGSRALRAGLLATAVSPYAWWPSQDLAVFDSPRFVAIMAAAALVAIGLATTSRPLVTTGRGAWTGGLAAVAAASMVAGAFGLIPSHSLTYGAEQSLMGAPVWVALAGLAVVVSMPSLRHTYRSLLSVVVVGGVLNALFGLVDRFSLGGAVSTFGNGNYLGTVLVTCLPLGLLLALSAKGIARTMWLLAAMTLVLGIGASMSATVFAVFVAQALALLVFAPHLLGAGEGRRRAASRVTGIGVAIGIVVVFLMWSVAPAALPSKLRSTLDAELAGPTLQSRLARWDMGAKIWLAHPVLGVGPDAIDVASQEVMTEEYVVREPVADGTNKLMRDPHALPLLILASTGMVGLAAAATVATVWLTLVVNGMRRLRAHRRDALLLVSMATLSFFACLMLIPWTVRFAALPALLGGIAVSFADHQAPRPRLQPSHGRRRPIVALLAVTVAALSVTLAGTLFAGQLAYLESQAASTPKAVLEAADLVTRIQPTRAAAWQRLLDTTGELTIATLATPEDYRDAYDRLPRMVHTFVPYEVETARTIMDYAVLYAEPPGFTDWGVGLAESALERVPVLPEAQAEAARAALFRGDVARASDLLDRAERLNYPKPRIYLYRYYLAQSEGDEAAASAWRQRLLEHPDTGPLALLAVDFEP